MKRGVIVFGLALLAGWAGGSAFRKVDRADVAEPLPSRVAEREPAVRQDKWSGEDFKEAARKLKPPRLGGRFTEELSGWTDAEIRAALDESLTKPEWLLSGNPIIEVAEGLFEEWVGRDFDAALAWFAALGSAHQQQLLSETLAKKWPVEKAAEAIAFLRERPDVFETYKKMNLVALGIEAEAAKGPQALAELLRILRSENLVYDMGQSKDFKIPADFDFGALAATDGFSGVWGSAEGRSLVAKWLVRDREAALAWILESKGAEEAGEIVSPAPGLSMKDHYHWLGGKLETWPDGDRRRFLEAAYRNLADFQFDEVPESLAQLAAGVRDPARADEVRALGVQGIYLGKLREVLPLLEEMDPARRMEALSAASLIWRPGFHRQSTPADVALLREKLVEWNAGGEQIETIIGRFKP